MAPQPSSLASGRDDLALAETSLATAADPRPKTRRAAWPGRWPALLPPLAFAIGGAALAAYQSAEAAPETAYLTLLGGWILGGAALLAPARSRLGSPAALLATLALWALTAGPARGAAFGVVLVATVCAAGWARLRHGELDLAAALGGALAVHALLRAGELLPAQLGLSADGIHAGAAAALARAVGPPLLAGGAVWLLARRCGMAGAIGVAMVTALAAGGFTVTAALPLLALAVATSEGWTTGTDGRATGLTTAARAIVIGAAVATLALTALRPAAGALAIAAAAAWRLPRRWAWAPAAALLVIAALSSSADAAAARVPAAVAVLVLLVPFAFHRDGVPPAQIAPALLLAAAGALLLPGTAGVAAAAAPLALAIRGTAAAALQRGWSSALLALAALVGGYPWLRDPLRGAFDRLGSDLSTGVLGAAVPAAAAIAAAWVLLAIARRASLRRAAVLLVASVALALLWAMPAPAWNVAPPEGVALRADAPEWSAALDVPVGRVRVVSTLAGAGDLPHGTPVAVLALERNRGSHLELVETEWTLRAGVDTGEWAADRPDLRGAAPRGPVWWSWLPPEGGYFAHAYAATWSPLTASPSLRLVPRTRLRIVRATGLPPDVTVSLLRVEVD